MKKKILSLAIAICMVATLLPSMVLTAGAEDTTTTASLTGTEYRLLYTFNTNVDGYTDGTEHTDENPIDDAIGFEDTKGMWSGFAEADSNFQPQIKGGGLYIPTKKNTTWYALKIRVPITNYYTVTFVKYEQKNTNTTYGVGNVYFLKETDAYKTLDNTNIADALETGDKLFESVNYVGNTTATYALGGTKYNQYLEAGEYIVIFNATNPNEAAAEGAEDAYRQSPAYIVLSTANAANTKATLTKDTKIYTGTVTLDKVELEIGGEQAHATTAVYSVADGYSGVRSFAHNKTLVTTGITFKSSKESVATVDSDGNITAVGPGTTEITAILTDGTYGSTIPATLTVTAPEEDQQFAEEFGEGTYETDSTPAFIAPTEGKATTTVNTYTAVIGGTNSTVTKHTVNLGEEFSITADEKDSDGNVFRYWALGLFENKKVLTRERTLKFMPTVESKHVIAVYEPENGETVTGESFYNANGQLLTDVKITDNKMPPLPSMTGYGTASAWVQYGTDEEFAEGADAPTENKMFVAKYAEPTTTYAINVVNGTKTGNVSYTYGEEVTCTATVPDGKVFKCWTKTVGDVTRIISLDSTYTFNVWEKCTLTAVFADKTPVFTGDKFSIILREMTEKVGDNTAYMAEFVGLGDAVEKGIQFGTKRVAMTTDAAQFTAVNDINGVVDANVKGYAILPDGTVIYDK